MTDTGPGRIAGRTVTVDLGDLLLVAAVLTGPDDPPDTDDLAAACRRLIATAWDAVAAQERPPAVGSAANTETAVCASCGGLVTRWTPSCGGPLAWRHDDAAQRGHAAQPIGDA